MGCVCIYKCVHIWMRERKSMTELVSFRTQKAMEDDDVILIAGGPSSLAYCPTTPSSTELKDQVTALLQGNQPDSCRTNPAAVDLLPSQDTTSPARCSKHSGTRIHNLIPQLLRKHKQPHWLSGPGDITPEPKLVTVTNALLLTSAVFNEAWHD